MRFEGAQPTAEEAAAIAVVMSFDRLRMTRDGLGMTQQAAAPASAWKIANRRPELSIDELRALRGRH